MQALVVAAPDATHAACALACRAADKAERNSFVHEIDISRWLAGSEMGTVQVTSADIGDPMMATMQTGKSARRYGYPSNGVPRFAEAYRLQMQAWVDALAKGHHVGASAWAGYVTTAIAGQVVGALASGNRIALAYRPRPALCAWKTEVQDNQIYVVGAGWIS